MMKVIRAPWLLAGWVGSAVLLLGVVMMLAWRQGAGPLVVGLEPEDKRAVTPGSFPADFGRLDDLVPFAGGVSPVAAAVVPVAHGPEFRDSDWVKAQGPEAWTLQVLASQDESAIKRFLAGLENRADYVYFAYPQDGQTWYVVTTGSYSSRELALGVADSLKAPDGARPFPRVMNAYQEALSAAEMAAAEPAVAVPASPPESSGEAADAVSVPSVQP